jgi:hypothetical protein
MDSQEYTGVHYPADAQTVVPTKATKAVIGTVIAVIGSGITAALALTAPDSDVFIVLTIASAVLTSAGVATGVYFTKNDVKVDV